MNDSLARDAFWAAVGLLGMLLAHAIVLLLLRLEIEAGIRLPSYAIAYVLVFPIAAAVGGRRRTEGWFARAVALCIVPAMYWFGTLASDGRLALSDLSFFDASSMAVVLPVTFVLCCVAGARSGAAEAESPVTIGQTESL